MTITNSAQYMHFSKGLFTWRWGTPGRWGNLLGWGNKITPLYMQSYRPAIPGCTFSRLLNGRKARKHEKCWQTTCFGDQCSSSLTCCSCCNPSVQWLSIVNFNNNAEPPPKWILRKFDVSRIRPRPGGLPHLETFTWQNFTPAERVTRSGRLGYPPWRVTPPIM